MAVSITSLEERLSCAICFEVYKEPQALKCLHTFCKVCVIALTKQGRVNCPECREVSSIDDIKDDFRLNGFVDYYKEQQRAVSRERALRREISGESVSYNENNATNCQKCTNGEVTFKCVDCGVFVCSDCSNNHTRGSLNNGHRIVSLHDIIIKAKTKLNTFIEHLESERNTMMKRAKNAEEHIKKIENQNMEQINTVNECIDNIIKSLEAHKVNLHQLINTANDNKIKELKTETMCLNQNRKIIEEKIGFMEELIVLEDVQVLDDAVKSIKKSLHQDIQALRKKLPKEEKNPVVSPVTVIKSETIEPHHVVSIRLGYDWKNCHPKKVQPHQTAKSDPHVSLQLTNTIQLSQAKVLPLDSHPRRIRLINDNLWVATSNGFQVFTRSGRFQNYVRHEQLNIINAFTFCHNGDILVASRQPKSLIRFEQSQKVVETILSQGQFSDVFAHHDEVYALDSHARKIVMLHYKMDGMKWSVAKEFSDLGICERLLVCQGHLFVSSLPQATVFAYSLPGKLLYTLGRGVFEKPLLCDVHQSGTMLLADLRSHNLQVIEETTRKRRVYNLPRDLPIGYCADAIFDKNSRFIWMLIQNKLVLLTSNT